MNHDVAIVGAGPVGLCMARALALQGLAVALVERQPQAAFAADRQLRYGFRLCSI